MPIITISRQFGSGGSEVAERVANSLGWQLYDNAVADEVASRLGITSSALSDREERVSTMAERLASTISLSALEMMPSVGDVALPPSEERIVEVTKRVMEEALSSGPSVIVGRGAQCLLATRTDALHVFCYAPFDALVSNTMNAHRLLPDEAKRFVVETNNRRAAYVKKHWKRDWLDVGNYHLCVNTAWLSIEGAAQLVTEIAKKKLG